MSNGFDISFGHNPQSGRNASPQGGQELPESTDPTAALSKMTPEQEDARLLSTMNNWWLECRDAHATNRAQQHIDADFYDHHQIDPAHAMAMEARGQAPLTYNLIKCAIDWVIGTERRTRIDWKIHPRGPEDQAQCEAKQVALKYVDDVNNGGFARSAAFTHAVKVGVGWTEECINQGGDEEPITYRHEDWKVMWWDPFAKALDLRDARYITRAKWLDVDYAITLFPEHSAMLERHARATDTLDMEDMEDPADVPGIFFNRSSHSYDSALRNSSPLTAGRRLRNRVRILETWYRKPVKVQRMSSLLEGLDRKVFNAKNPEHVQAAAQGMVSLHDGLSEKTFVCLWVPGSILSRKESPYKHNRYPFTPIFAYRDDKSCLPYGLIRGMRDAQEDYNKRRAKALYLLSTNRLIYEDGVVAGPDEQDFLDEAAAPNAQLKVAAGALKDRRIVFESGAELAAAQLTMMEQSKDHIFDGNGITRENLGQESNAISGRAILAKQQQGAVTTAELFDNYRFSFRISGQKELSLIEQFMTMPKRLRIVGPKGTADWMTVNEPRFDPATGELIFANDLSAAEADFYVDQQDYRETVRMAMAEALFETIKGLAPENQMLMLDLAIELTDIPNREEWVRRIRSVNGQGTPGQEQTPEAIAAEEAKNAALQRDQQLTEAERMAKIRKDNAGALSLETGAKKTNTEVKGIALDIAKILAGALPLAPTADRLTEFPAPELVPQQEIAS